MRPKKNLAPDAPPVALAKKSKAKMPNPDLPKIQLLLWCLILFLTTGRSGHRTTGKVETMPVMPPAAAAAAAAAAEVQRGLAMITIAVAAAVAVVVTVVAVTVVAGTIAVVEVQLAAVDRSSQVEN